MDKIKKKYLFLLIIIIIGIIMGFLFANILSSSDQKIVFEKISSYFNNLKNDIMIDYGRNLFVSIKNNIIYLILIVVFGLSIIGLLFNNFILFLKSFILGFSFGSIINIYLYRGIILGFIYVFPIMIFNILIYAVMISRANDVSIKLYNVLFKKKEYQFAYIIKNYFKLAGISLILLLLSSVYETFITPFTIKLFSFLIK